MTLRLYNTLTRSLQPFEPLHPPAVTMYVCGPTVYDVPHIGHARSACIFDVLRRYLAYKKFTVTFVRNVTDVDDKIIQKAREELETADRGQQTGDNLKKKCQAVAERSLKSYHEALDRLGIQPPDKEPRATEHVLPDDKHIDASMTGFIAQLLVKGAAYEAGGDVYFAVRKFPGYGKLSNRSVDELQSGARVEPGEQKQDPLDFALWKTAKPDEPSWNSPWGKGRPGWHIECSVMSTRYLGDAFDIHGGGVDLVFPHHENEIAQAQALGKPFAKYWIHNGLLTVKGEKMSKSLGNFITVEQALKECGNEAEDVLKFFFLGVHYRSPIDYTVANLDAAGGRLDGLLSFLHRADTWRSSSPPQALCPEAAQLEQEFENAMSEDLNTSEALAVLDKLANYGNQWVLDMRLPEKMHPQEELQDSSQKFSAIPMKIVRTADSILKLGRILGLFSRYFELTPELRERVNEREMARRQKNFEKADKIRKEFEGDGLIIEDSERGPIVRRKR